MAAMESVEVVVGERYGDAENAAFRAVKVRFNGQQVGVYETENLTYTLYRCGGEGYHASYRVHEKDERDPRSPRYRLHPYEKDPEKTGDHPVHYDYDVYNARQVVARWPIFVERTEEIKDTPRQIDAPTP
jgi:hypothetical protein